MLRRANEVKLHLKAIIYGAPGAGKTTLATSGWEHPNMRETLIVDFEGGTLSVSNTGALVTPLIRTTASLAEVYLGLKDRTEEYESIGTVVLDSGSKFQEMVIAEVMAQNVKDGKLKGDGSPRTEEDLEIQDYGKATKICHRILERFRSLEMNVIMTALARETSPEASISRPNPPPTDVRPDFMPKLGNHLMGCFDHVWYMMRNEGSHLMLTQRKGVFMAKTRGHMFADGIGERVDNPKLGDIFDTLQRTQGPQT